MSCGSALSFDELLSGLLEMFAEDKDKVNVDDVIEWFNRYESKEEDWNKFAKWDKFKYTRNLMHEGNGNFNLILMCWPEGTVSPIHDHSNAHCFMRIIEGTAKEVRYYWPEDKSLPDGSLVQCGSREVGAGNTLYISDEIGLHKVENVKHNEKLVSIHLYSPPFTGCNIFDERTSKKTSCKMTFFSRFGEKVDHRKSKKISTTAAPMDTDSAATCGQVAN